MKSNKVLKVFAIFLALIMLLNYVPTSVIAENAVVQQSVTVEPQVLEQLEKSGTATFWIEYENTADLTAAYQMEWAKRGVYVYETLKAQADKSQATAISLLEIAGIDYQPFWIANRILVKNSNSTTLSSLQQLPGVVAIRAPKDYAIWEPQTVSVEPTTLESNISHILAPEAWELGFDGTDVTIASIDTGVRYTHEALQENYRGNNGDGTFSHDYSWFSPIVNAGAPRDGHGHGTHTMGTILGATVLFVKRN